MQKIYLLTVLLLALLNAKAQIDTTTLTGKYEYIFEQLDRNQIPTGFIDERAFLSVLRVSSVALYGLNEWKRVSRLLIKH